MNHPNQASAHRNEGFGALADPTRRRIIALLAEEDLTVKEIAARFSISRPAISKHLRVLQRSGLVVAERRGREHVQRFDGKAMKSLAEWINHYEAFWRNKLAALKHIVEKEQ